MTTQEMPMHTVIGANDKRWKDGFSAETNEEGKTFKLQTTGKTEQPVARRFSGGLFATKLSAEETEKLGFGNENRFGRLIAVFSVQATSQEEAEGIVLARHWTPNENRVDFKGLRPHFRHDSYKAEQGEPK